MIKNQLLLLAILGLFFWFGIASSVKADKKYPAIVEVLPNAIVLTSKSDIPIENAWLEIKFHEVHSFFISNYNLAANDTDTIPFSTFVPRDSVTISIGQAPDYFGLRFFEKGISFSVEHKF